jgi:hypothetical protein
MRLRDPKSQFYKWTERQRDERLAQLAEVIKRHTLYGIISAVPVEPYLRLFKGRHNQSALDFAARKDLREKIDFIFDEEGGELPCLLQEQYEVLLLLTWLIFVGGGHHSGGIMNYAPFKLPT